MRIVVLIARLLLGLIFLVFGLNGFLNVLNMGPLPTGLAGQFISALLLSHYLWFIVFYAKRQYFSGVFAQQSAEAV